jgi:hypothetical protein
MPYKNKEKQKEYQREWIRNNPEQKEKNIKSSRMRKRKNKLLLDKYKNNIGCYCRSCGIYDHPLCMDFHHLDRTEKRGTVSEIASHGYKWEVVQNEIDKCILLCSSCHRKVHEQLICFIDINNLDKSPIIL